MRHKKVEKRKLEPDKVHSNLLVAKFINHMMRDGKKSVAQKKFYSALERIAKKEEGQDPVSVFEKAIQNVGPKVEVKARRVGGASYQVPIEVRHDRRTALAMRWILEAARKRSNKELHTFEEKLAAEFIDASQNAGEAVKKRDVAHRMAEANKAFAHFRW
ncbi:MAG: 30S ribosomal protein S7 [Candidatus Levybacteria bacterium]|nr:30S ribosomal protein S7 [Candidatus Levybacteria bacterium]